MLQQLVSTLSQLVQTLQAQLQGGGPATTAQADAGAANVSTDGGGAMAGCGMAGCGMAASGADQIGQDPAPSGGNGAPPANVDTGKKDSKKTGANGAPDDTQGPAPAGASDKQQKAVELAKSQLGKPYKWAAAGPDSYDCSGLTMWIMKQLGVKLPHHAADQAKMGTPVDKKDLQPGDLIFFSNPSEGIHHTGIYIGDGKFIHAPHTGDVVKISSLSESYYQKEFDSARRFL